MKKNFGTGRKPTSDTDQISQSRRKLLMGCAWLSVAPLLGVLGGCSDSDNAISDADAPSTFEPPPSTAEIPPPIPAPVGLRIPLPPFSAPGDTGVLASQQTQRGQPDTGDAASPGVSTPATSTPATSMADASSADAPAPVIASFRPQSSWPGKVGIYNLDFYSFRMKSARRTVPEGTHGAVTVADPKDKAKTITYEGIETCLKRALDNKFALLYRAMAAGFEKHPPLERKFDVSFLVAPEFFWNVPWGDFLDETELVKTLENDGSKTVADLILDTVTRHTRTLISQFPVDKYGHIVLLPGTIAVLKAMPELKLTGAPPAGLSSTIYEATNRLVCAHNLPTDDKNHPPPAYMIWPKRIASDFDYDRYPVTTTGPGGISVVTKACTSAAIKTKPDGSTDVHLCGTTKSGLSIYIKKTNAFKGQSFDSQGNALPGKFENDIIDGLPFGIDVCLDHYLASVETSARRDELDKSMFKLDFLVACGQGLMGNNFKNTPTIQYAIRNDGFNGLAGTEVKKLSYDETGKITCLDGKDRFKPETALNPLAGEIPVFSWDNTAVPVASPVEGVIPEILDKMNTAKVLVWSLDIDNSDKPVAAHTLVASNPPSNLKKEPEIQFIQ